MSSMTKAAAPSVVGGRDVDSARLGAGAYGWKVGPTHVDLSMPSPEPVAVTIRRRAAEHHHRPASARR